MALTSIIIPVFNEEKNVVFLAEGVRNNCRGNYEIIFIDDGSRDTTLLEISRMSQLNSNIRCVSFSRNFGHQNAIMAGLKVAKGDYTIIMDGDGQHPPELIPEMLQKLDEGFDLVNTKRQKTEGIGTGKKIFTTVFYSFLNNISDTPIEPNVSDFRAFNKKVLHAVLKFRERDLFLRGIFSWVGFNSTTIPFNAPARLHGETKYTFSRMVRLGLRGITAFSFKPLRIAFVAGSIISLASFTFGIFALISYFQGNTVPGWASTIIALLFLGGTQLLAIGLLGEYIASLFVESKKRPLYIINETINIDQDFTDR